jgi:O-antigen/teichoic acid export membrane protein
MATIPMGESWSSTLKRTMRPSILAVLDQCLFSGTNFVTAVVIGRIAGDVELGVYALCFSLTMICIATQRALLVSPFVVVSARLDALQSRELQGSMLIATLIIAGSLALLATVAFAFVSPMVAIAVMVVMPAGLFRDFHRRLALARMQLVLAFSYDFVVAVCQIGLLAFLAWSERLTATSVLLGCSCIWIVTSVITFLVTRDIFLLVPSRMKQNLVLLWPIGRWIGLSQLVATTEAFALPWVMAIAGSLKLAGVYAACWTIVQVASPVIEGLGNLLSPALARSANGKSLDAMKYQARMATLVFSLMMIGLVLIVAILGRQLLVIFYGDLFSDAYLVLLLLTLSAAANNIGVPSSKALTQLGKAKWIFVLSSVSLLITLTVAIVCLKLFGSSGAAWGLLLSAVVSTITIWILLDRSYRSLSAKHEDPSLVTDGAVTTEGVAR